MNGFRPGMGYITNWLVCSFLPEDCDLIQEAVSLLNGADIAEEMNFTAVGNKIHMTGWHRGNDTGKVADQYRWVIAGIKLTLKARTYGNAYKALQSV